MPLYYDHKNKVVRLDLPVGETGNVESEYHHPHLKESVSV